MTQNEEFERLELKQAEAQNITQRQNLLSQKQLEAQVIQHSLSEYIQNLCKEYNVSVSRVVNVSNGELLLEKEDGLEDESEGDS